MAATKQTLGAEERRERTLMFLTPIVSVLLALVVGAIIIACLGKNPLQGYAPPQPWSSASGSTARRRSPSASWPASWWAACGACCRAS